MINDHKHEYGKRGLRMRCACGESEPQTNDQATARPWTVNEMKLGSTRIIAEVERAVRAVNSHEALISALEELMTGHSLKGEEQARQALKLAKGE